MTPPEQCAEAILSFNKEERPDLFRQALAIREVVFVEEQAVPPEHEQDALDDTATHFLMSLDKEPVATARIFPDGEPAGGVVRVGRVAVLAKCRGMGLGRLIMAHLLEHATQAGFREAVLDGQIQAKKFYENLGFVAEGEEFMEEGIPHVFMRKAL